MEFQGLGDIAKAVQEKVDLMKKSGLITSSERPENKPKCSKCLDTGTVHIKAWEEYMDRGKPMRYEKGTIKLCDCHFDSMFEKYNAALGMKSEEHEHKFKRAEIDDENRVQFEIGADFIKNIEFHREAGTWLYIFGDEKRAKEFGVNAYGTGKSYLMHCIGNALTFLKISAIYVPEYILFEDIKSTYQKNSEETESQVLQKYYNVPILLIDDLFTAQYNTEWAESKLFNILESRKGNKKITIITSNYAVNRIRERLPINGAKIASRIIGEAIEIEMVGRDRRQKVSTLRSQKRRNIS